MTLTKGVLKTSEPVVGAGTYVPNKRLVILFVTVRNIRSEIGIYGQNPISAHLIVKKKDPKPRAQPACQSRQKIHHRSQKIFRIECVTYLMWYYAI